MKVDLHVHTNCSDGTANPEDIVMRASKIGLGGMAIADHDTMEGYKKAAQLAKKLGLLLIPAVEITTNGGDILALGVSKIPKGSLSWLINEIHRQGGIAVLCHPFAGYWPNPITAKDEYVKLFDALEIFNATTQMERNIAAMELAKRLKMPGIAASDAHFLEAIAAAFISVNAKTIKGVFEKIKTGSFKVGWI